MTVVFVHGVPETDAIWDPLVARLGRDDVVRLSPPGFGSPLPPDFEPVRASYVTWLADSLRGLAAEGVGPIDLVGHDWGAGHTLGLVASEVELVRSWACDVAGIVHPDYEWHDIAQLWRTPEVGEQTVAGMMDPPVEQKAELLGSLGLTPDIARRVAEANDATMGRCILSLYRSADPGSLREVWDGLPRAAGRPGLILIPTEDHYAGPLTRAEEVAAHAGASTATLDGLGHWWMVQDPGAAAAALEGFWSGLD